MIKRGDIVLLSFPFTNLKSSKVRPALVVSEDSFNKISKDRILLFVTSKKYSTPFNIRVLKSSSSFQATGLKKASTFRVSKLMCLDQSLVQRRLGRADTNLLKKVDAALRCLLGL